MSVKPRLFAAAATTFLALSAGAAPALASGRGPAAQEAFKLQPTIQLNIDPSGTAAQMRSEIAQLEANAKKSDHAALLVSRTHPKITDGRDLWVKGVRLQAIGDRELVNGLRLELAGKTAAGRQKISAAIDPRNSALNVSNTDIAHADGLLGIDAALAKSENG
jgi:hypothetical protein